MLHRLIEEADQTLRTFWPEKRDVIFNLFEEHIKEIKKKVALISKAETEEEKKNVTDYFLVSAQLKANNSSIPEEPDLEWPGGNEKLSKTICKLNDAGLIWMDLTFERTRFECFISHSTPLTGK